MSAGCWTPSFINMYLFETVDMKTQSPEQNTGYEHLLSSGVSNWLLLIPQLTRGLWVFTLNGNKTNNYLRHSVPTCVRNKYVY